MNCCCFVIYIICFIFYIKIVCTKQNGENLETVLITSSSNVKYIEIPTSDDPILTWMEVHKGKFPNIIDGSPFITNVTIGDPVTLFIFFKDDSNLYNIKVNDCWAYDDQNIFLSKQKLHLTDGTSNRISNKMLSEWEKSNYTEGPNFLYASFTSFKFPDKDQLYLTCDIQLVGRKQSK